MNILIPNEYLLARMIQNLLKLHIFELEQRKMYLRKVWYNIGKYRVYVNLRWHKDMTPGHNRLTIHKFKLNQFFTFEWTYNMCLRCFSMQTRLYSLQIRTRLFVFLMTHMQTEKTPTAQHLIYINQEETGCSGSAL